jgi:hypothetical protein
MRIKRAFCWGFALLFLLCGLASCTTSKDEPFAALPVEKTAGANQPQAPG